MFQMKFFVIIFSILLISSCKYVDDAKLKIFSHKDNLYFSAEAKITKEVGVTLPYVNLPIYDFHQFKQLGKLIMQGGNQIYFELNASEIFSDYFIDEGVLPNGNPLPFILDQDVKIYSFIAGSSHTRIYVAVDGEIAIAGVAVPIVGMSLPTHSDPFEIMAGFKMHEVYGAIGTFHGPKVGQNGFAIFFNISDILTQLTGERNFVGKQLKIPFDVQNPSFKKRILVNKLRKQMMKSNLSVELY